MTQAAYYNEHDAYAAAWLRNLVAAGLIAAGDVDERGIQEVRGDELKGYSQVHLFAGLGGWSAAARLAGWPDDRPLWTGSCPCQPFSAAGKGLGEADPRHLWPWMRGLVAECRPAVVFGEQVASRAGRGWLDGVRTDLEGMGYAVGAADLCAASAGAPHIRQRLFWVADAGRLDCTGRGVSGDVDGEASPAESEAPQWEWMRDAAHNGGAACRLADSIGTGQRPGPWRGQSGGASEERNNAGWSGAVSRMGDPTGRGPTGANGAGESEQGPGSGCEPRFWDAFDVLPFRDGKARRVEPGSFPLATGSPARVGKLRTYGNAIVPQVAASFMSAWMVATASTGTPSVKA